VVTVPSHLDYVYFTRFLSPGSPWTNFVILFSTSILAAGVLYWAVERPFLLLRERFRTPQRAPHPSPALSISCRVSHYCFALFFDCTHNPTSSAIPARVTGNTRKSIPGHKSASGKSAGQFDSRPGLLTRASIAPGVGFKGRRLIEEVIYEIVLQVRRQATGQRRHQCELRSLFDST
jgi:hypothetical protein